ncbi:E3 ubiquitin-protein ligase [Rhynchospora pubera]|uniref:E3 ubiquitin-protein ligase RMA n=1 Tax=Rhynchospora pubera TaxID=906938 RepID=A0AAV8EX18_9POAL|nr:E3 ubiquitin-protein ligase [Rhynchospora pubera]
MRQMDGEAPPSSSFDCNICLESVSEPVVTVCGHLYCWSCINGWVHHQHKTTGPTCPTCKSPISYNSLIPLYGQGSSTSKFGTSNRPSRINCTRSMEEEEDQLIMNDSNFNTWVDDRNFRNYCGLAGFAIGLTYDCPYRRLNVSDATQVVRIEIRLRLLLSLLLIVVLGVLLF